MKAGLASPTHLLHLQCHIFCEVVLDLLFPVPINPAQVQRDPSLLWAPAILVSLNCNTSLNCGDFYTHLPPFMCLIAVIFSPSVLSIVSYTFGCTNGWFVGGTERPGGREVLWVWLVPVQIGWSEDLSCAGSEKRGFQGLRVCMCSRHRKALGTRKHCVSAGSTGHCV